MISKFNHTLGEFHWYLPLIEEVMDLGDIISDIIDISINSSMAGDMGMIARLLYIGNYLLVYPEYR